MNAVTMKEFIMKQARKIWNYIYKPRSYAAEDNLGYEAESIEDQHLSVCENQELTEPHLIRPPLKPEHAAAAKHNHKVKEFLGQNAEFGDSDTKDAEGLYDLQPQLSKMAAREAELLCRLRDAEEAHARQREKQNLDQLSRIRLEEENARLVAKVVQMACEVNVYERAWQKKLHQLKSLNYVLLREREKAWEIERAALMARIHSLQKHGGKLQ
uniref:Uncharacterized protein n=1 Tax=Tetraodon nigroviridis TaxID=99883 RepID=H3BYL4_TETNG